MKFCARGETYVTHHAKRDLMGIAKSTDPGQLAQSAQVDHGQNCHFKLTNHIGLCLLCSHFYYFHLGILIRSLFA